MFLRTLKFYFYKILFLQNFIFTKFYFYHGQSPVKLALAYSVGLFSKKFV